MLGTLAFSQGIPMISHGDELGRTQRGNNNAYAQDNETSWVHWDLEDWQAELLAFTREIFRIRHTNPVLRRRTYLRGRPVGAAGVKDVAWLRRDGAEMTDEDWHAPDVHVLGMLISGEAADETDDRGRPVQGETMLLLLNGGDTPVTFEFPRLHRTIVWTELVETSDDAQESPEVRNSDTIAVAPFSLILLRAGSDRRVRPAWRGSARASTGAGPADGK
jgi:glycogen operon protein